MNNVHTNRVNLLRMSVLLLLLPEIIEITGEILRAKFIALVRIDDAMTSWMIIQIVIKGIILLTTCLHNVQQFGKIVGFTMALWDVLNFQIL